MFTQLSYDHRSYERNLSNCVWKPEKVTTSTGFEPETSRYGCNCLNCVHNCDDHSLLDFKIRSSIYEIFHISLHCLLSLHGALIIWRSLSKTHFRLYFEPLDWEKESPWITLNKFFLKKGLRIF